MFVDEDHLARLNLADEFCFDQVEGAGFRSDHIAFTELAKHQGPETVRIPYGDHAGLGQKDDTVGALDGEQGFSDTLREQIA